MEESLAITRIGDRCLVHCSTPYVATGSPNVFANGIPVSRIGDITTPHLLPCGVSCCIHSAPIAQGSSVVFVNGIPASRLTSKIAGCTIVIQGSPNVYVAP